MLHSSPRNLTGSDILDARCLTGFPPTPASPFEATGSTDGGGHFGSRTSQGFAEDCWTAAGYPSSCRDRLGPNVPHNIIEYTHTHPQYISYIPTR